MKINTLPQGAEYELFSERVRTDKVSYKGNILNSVESKDILDASLRLAHNGKVVISKTSCLKNVDQLVTDAAKTVKYGSEQSSAFASATDIKSMTLSDSKTLSSKEMVGIVDELVSKLKKLDPRLTATAELSHKTIEKTLKTSLGFDGGYKKTIWDLFAYATLIQGDDRFDILSYGLSMHPNLSVQAIVDEIEKQLEWGRNVVDFKPGSYPVIFAPEEVTNIINPVIASLDGEAFYNKTSPWIDKLGTKVLDERISLFDDGSIDKHYASKPFDDEGTKTQRNTLVEGGVIKSITLDNEYGARLDKPSTGNFDGLNHLFMAPGTKSFDEMVKSIDYGMVITRTMGAWSGNPFAGIVSGTVSCGLKVENGNIVGRVKDTMFTVNSFEHLNKHVVDISSEQKTMDVDGFFTLPSLLLDKVVITSE